MTQEKLAGRLYLMFKHLGNGSGPCDHGAIRQIFPEILLTEYSEKKCQKNNSMKQFVTFIKFVDLSYSKNYTSSGSKNYTARGK